MNTNSQPFASYIAARDEIIRVAQNKAVRVDESHSALVAAGFPAALKWLIVNATALAIEKAPQPKIEPKPT